MKNIKSLFKIKVPCGTKSVLSEITQKDLFWFPREPLNRCFFKNPFFLGAPKKDPKLKGS